MGRTRLRGTRKDPLTILRVLIWSLMRETQRVRQRVGPWPTVPPTPICAWPSRPRSARSALGCGAGGAAAEGQEGLSSSVPGDTRRVEGLGPNVTAGPRSPRTAARVRLRDPRPCTLGTEGLCVTVRAPAAVNPRPPRLTWLLRPIWKPERAHRNHDAEQMRDPRKHGGPATHGPATEGCGMFQNRPPHTDSSSIRIQKTLSKLGDLKSSWAAPQPLLSTWVQVIRPERIEAAPSLLVLNPVGGRAAEAGGDGVGAGLLGGRCARSPRGQRGATPSPATTVALRGPEASVPGGTGRPRLSWNFLDLPRASPE